MPSLRIKPWWFWMLPERLWRPRARHSDHRAELMALAALTWGAFSAVELCLWSDSQSTIHVAEHIQKFDEIPEGASNHDLWHLVQQALRDRAGVLACFHWVPSHVPASEAEDPFEEWVIHWNDLADQLAVHTNYQRSAAFKQMHQALRNPLHHWDIRLQQLQQFFFLVADRESRTIDGDNETIHIESSDEDDMLWTAIEDNLPVNWQMQCLHNHAAVPGAFLVGLINWLCAAERLRGPIHGVSELELVFFLLLDKDCALPFQVDGSLGVHLRTPDSLFQRPTIGHMLRSVQHALKSIFQLFPFFAIKLPRAPAPSLGVQMQFAGLRISEPSLLRQEMMANLRRFTATRPIRRVSDLARPVT